MAPVPVYVFNRRELRSPLVIMAILIVYVVWRRDWIGLVGLPLVYVSWCGCAPNLNLVDGCLPVLATVVATVLGLTLGQVGLSVAAGASGVTWIVASIESARRCKPEVIQAEPDAEGDEDAYHRGR
jgi:hypothetical protein